MKFSSTSKYMLKYQKAKAKLIEYGVHMDEYPKFPLNSNELSYPVIYIISRYVESIIENNEADRLEFLPLLTVASQYFDAAVNAKDRVEHDYDFLLSGTTAYFLSDDFGSAKVLCSAIKNEEVIQNNTPPALLKSLYDLFLIGKNVRPVKTNTIYGEVLNSLIEYFNTGKGANDINNLLIQYRHEVYISDNPVGIFYIDILFAVVIETIKKSTLSLLPQYSGLESSL